MKAICIECFSTASESVRVPGMPAFCRRHQNKVFDTYPMVTALMHTSMFSGSNPNILEAVQFDSSFISDEDGVYSR